MSKSHPPLSFQSVVCTIDFAFLLVFIHEQKTLVTTTPHGYVKIISSSMVIPYHYGRSNEFSPMHPLHMGLLEPKDRVLSTITTTNTDFGDRRLLAITDVLVH